MSIQLISNEGNASECDSYTVMYDSVTMTAFGPVMPSLAWAEAFLQWLRVDARNCSAGWLSEKWAWFNVIRAECVGCGDVAKTKGGQLTSSGFRCDECCNELAKV